MTIKDFYILAEGDYGKALEDLEQEERIRRYLRKFPENQMHQRIKQALETQDYTTAFREAHSLKGMCMNISLTKLTALSSDLTEHLRQGPTGEEETAYELMKREYEKVCELIGQLD